MGLATKQPEAKREPLARELLSLDFSRRLLSARVLMRVLIERISFAIVVSGSK
jgi:hypothetical protein